MEVKLIECPRDAMQGIPTFIETEKKTAYINQLLHVGFDTIDFGSFVSPQAIPQMRDTAVVLEGLDLSAGNTKLLAIVANERGAKDACVFEEIDYLGFPFSISETFQQRNTNSSIEHAFTDLAKMQKLCIKHNKKLVVYISMAFGNPYGDSWTPEIAGVWAERIHTKLGVEILALSDTIGVADEASISALFKELITNIPAVEFGAHLHAKPQDVQKKLQAAYDAGCRRFDGAIKGFGGCPMAKDELTGNMNTELMLDWFAKNKINLGIKQDEFNKSLRLSDTTFPH